jgi:predicted small secreted protein
MTTRRIAASLGLVALSLLLTACGSSGAGKDSASASQPLASSADFPSSKGKSLLQIKHGLGPGPVLAPTVSVVSPGRDRYGFGLFDRARKQIAQAPVALYVERSGSRKVSGPFLAHDLPLAVRPAFRSETVAKDPDAAKSLYVADLRVKQAGDYAVLGVAKLDGRLVATDPVYLGVGAPSQVPKVGQKAPVITTPTVKSVGGDVSKIDTRTPPDSMHDVNFADVLGKKPIILVFATPALCQSRVCGPVVDIAEEVKSEHKGEAAFIHMEIYNGNTIAQGCLEGTRLVNQCLRPQVLAYHLPTEPWAFAIDRHGKIVDRLEGAFSKSELETALKLAETR